MKIRIYDSARRTEPKSGYGLMSREIADNLYALGHEVCFFPRQGDTEDVILWIRPPYFIKKPEFLEENKNVFFTMHESTVFTGNKADWPELLNKCTAIMVPTPWNKAVFKAAGITKPIYVVPLGVNSKKFHGAKTPYFSILTLHDNLGGDDSRENWKDTIRAYYEAFEPNDQIFLTIKSYNIKRGSYYEYLHAIQTEYKKVLPVEVMEIDIDEQALNNLYSSHWLFVKDANREGWSLPLLEAISCGMEVAYTKLPPLQWATDYPKGNIFKPGDIKALTKIFKDKYKKFEESKAFVNKFSWKETAKKVEEVLQSV